jgi:hypothetical protein
MTLTVADELDFLSFYSREPPPIWIGICVKRSRRIIAFGLVVWNEHGAACGFVDRRQPVSAFTVHRAAYRILAALREVGEESLYVQCDGSIPDAEKWLRRLGFAPMENDPTVWRLVLLEVSHGNALRTKGMERLHYAARYVLLCFGRARFGP